MGMQVDTLGLYCETQSSAPTSSGRKDLDCVTELYEVLQKNKKGARKKTPGLQENGRGGKL